MTHLPGWPYPPQGHSLFLVWGFKKRELVVSNPLYRGRSIAFMLGIVATKVHQSGKTWSILSWPLQGIVFWHCYLEETPEATDLLPNKVGQSSIRDNMGDILCFSPFLAWTSSSPQAGGTSSSSFIMSTYSFSSSSIEWGNNYPRPPPQSRRIFCKREKHKKRTPIFTSHKW